MSRALVSQRRPSRLAAELHPSGVVVLGLGLLLLRPLADGRPTAALVIGGTYVLLGAMSVATPEPYPRPALMSPLVVLAIGCGAFLLSGIVSRPTIPAPVAQSALVLNSLAAVAEEAFFRQFLFGRLARHGSAVAIVGSAVVFALIHVPAYGLAALWVDLGAGLLLSWQRWASGRWTVPAATHVLANLMAVMP